MHSGIFAESQSLLETFRIPGLETRIAVHLRTRIQHRSSIGAKGRLSVATTRWEFFRITNILTSASTSLFTHSIVRLEAGTRIPSIEISRSELSERCMVVILETVFRAPVAACGRRRKWKRFPMMKIFDLSVEFPAEAPWAGGPIQSTVNTIYIRYAMLGNSLYEVVLGRRPPKINSSGNFQLNPAHSKYDPEDVTR